MCLGTLLQWHLSFAQTTVNIPLSKDAYLVSGSPSSNYGNSEVLVAGSKDVRVAMFRTALQVDLSSIPENAVISSAKLFLYKHTGYTTSGNEDFLLERFESSWSEASISYSSQPRTDGTTIKLLEKANGLYSFDITSDVINMYNGTQVNYGWLLRAGNETVNDSEEYFYSKEYKTVALRPYVEVVYSSPFIVTDAVINHATDSTTNDGSISPDISGGSGNYTYSWIEGSSGSNLGSSASLNGLSSGWYGVHITDDSTSEELYMAFIVGAKDGEFTVDFNPGPNYTDDAMIYDLVRNGVDYGENNYGTYSSFRAENWTYGSWYDVRSLLKFRLWMDPTFNINKADLYLSGYDHYPLSRPNTSEFRKIIEPWEENEVTHHSRPTIGSTPLEVLSATPQGNENKVVDMRSFWNEWALSNTENYGVMLQLQLYNDQYTRMKYYSSDAADPATRPWIKFELSLPVSVSWDVTSGLGEVQVDVSSLSATGPYHYIISSDPIPDLVESYQLISDSLPITIDSVSFFKGFYTGTSHTFEGYEAGKYFVSVFDSQQNRILDEVAYLSPPLQFETELGLVSEGSTISSVNGEGYGSLTLYTSEKVDGGFEVELSRALGETQFVGLMSKEVGLKGVENLSYGVYLDEDQLFTVYNGVVDTTDTFAIPLSMSSLVFEIKSGVLEVRNSNGDEYLSEILPSSYAYQVALGTAESSTMDVKIVEGFTLKSMPTVSINVTPGSCFDSNGTIELGYTVSGLFAQYYQFDAPTVTNILTNVTTTMNTVSPGVYGISNLLPGTYIVYPSGTFTTSSSTVVVPFTPQVVHIHSKVVWTGLIETEYSPLGNFPQSESLSRNSLSSGEIVGSAQVKHELDIAGDNALFFNLNLPNVLDNCILRWTDQVDVAATLYSGISQESFTGIIFVRGSNGVFVGKLVNGVMQGIQGPQTAFAPVSNGASLGYYYSSSTLEAWLEESTFGNGTTSLIPSYSVGGNPTHLSVNTGNLGTGIYNVLTNMPCIVPDIYAKVDRKLRGVKYRVYENALRFYVDEEYNSTGSLRYRIFSEDDRVTPAQDWQTVPTSVEYGDNRFVLNVTNISSGVFILEVENEKKEKFYLRFEN